MIYAFRIVYRKSWVVVGTAEKEYMSRVSSHRDRPQHIRHACINFWVTLWTTNTFTHTTTLSPRTHTYHSGRGTARGGSTSIEVCEKSAIYVLPDICMCEVNIVGRCLRMYICNAPVETSQFPRFTFAPASITHKCYEAAGAIGLCRDRAHKVNTL